MRGAAIGANAAVGNGLKQQLVQYLGRTAMTGRMMRQQMMMMILEANIYIGLWLKVLIVKESDLQLI